MNVILLHGGLTPEMIGGLVGGFIGSIWLLIRLLTWGLRSRFYKEVFGSMPASRKVFIVILFISVTLFLFILSFYFFLFLFAWIISLF
jgi:hypothetical protein